MTDIDSVLTQRVHDYAVHRSLMIVDQLGSGVDGIVYSTNKETAIKALKYPALFERERDVYLRLQKNDVHMIEDFHVPKLVNFNEHLLIVEMEIVTRPFIVDFAGAYLDEQPPFQDENWSEWEESRRELFEHDWGRVVTAMASLRRYGIYLNDVKPGNVSL